MCNTHLSPGITPGKDRDSRLQPDSNLKWEEALLSRREDVGEGGDSVTQQLWAGACMVLTQQMKEFSKCGQSNIMKSPGKRET